MRARLRAGKTGYRSDTETQGGTKQSWLFPLNSAILQHVLDVILLLRDLMNRREQSHYTRSDAKTGMKLRTDEFWSALSPPSLWRKRWTGFRLSKISPNQTQNDSCSSPFDEGLQGASIWQVIGWYLCCSRHWKHACLERRHLWASRHSLGRWCVLSYPHFCLRLPCDSSYR